MITDDTRCGQLPAHFTAFGRALRHAGVPVDSSRIALAIDAAQAVGVADKNDLHCALQSVFIGRPQDLVVFDEMFEAFFQTPERASTEPSRMPSAGAPAQPVRRKPRVQEALDIARPSASAPPSVDQALHLEAAMAASDRQRLREADFEGLSASELRLVEQLVRSIPLPLPRVRARRHRAAPDGHRPHWARALQEARRHDGELLNLPRMTRRPQPLPLLILVDVSGSMASYARLLLAFLHAATRQAPRAAFAFGTGLSDLRVAFRQRDTDQMLALVNPAIADFAGGTRLADSLAQLRRAHARCLVGRRTVVLMVTDGLDTGEPQWLDQELQWLRRHTRQLLWLNPLLRYEGYAPLARGPQVLNRHAHAMLAVHNLNSLQALARSLAALLQRAGA